MLMKDMTGQTFGKLQVVCVSKKIASDGKRMWVCECECGQIEVIRGYALRSGRRTCCEACAPRRPGRPVGPINRTEVMTGLHEAKTDCRAYVDGRCVALVEMFCRTKGECKFYKSRLDNSSQE